MNKDNNMSPSFNTPENTGDKNLSVDDFHKAFGIEFGDTLDIEKWHIGQNLAELYPKIEDEWIKAKSGENKNHKVLREAIFPRIKEKALVPFAGISDDIDSVTELIERIHKGFLFNGAVTACSGTIASYKSVPLSVSQIGICLINYERQHGTYSHTLFQQDLRYKNNNPLQEALDILERRKSQETGRSKGEVSQLAVRGIKAFMERAILLEKRNPKSKWILGGGVPTPYEIMTDLWATRKEFSEKSIGLMRKMVLEHQRFVYVHGCEKFPDLWTFGNALLPFEYLIIDSIEDNLTERIESGGTRGQIRDSYFDFAKEVGSKIVRGVFRVSMQAEPQIFYGHIDHIRTAALIAMADSVFQLYQGSPMLLDLASQLCDISFNKNDIVSTIHEASRKAEAKLKIAVDTKQ